MRSLLSALQPRFRPSAATDTSSVSGLLARRLVLGLGLLVALALAAGCVARGLPRASSPTKIRATSSSTSSSPPAASLQRTDEVCAKVEAILHETPGVRSYIDHRGFQPSLAELGDVLGVLLRLAEAVGRTRPRPRRRPRESSSALNRRFFAIPAATVVAFAPPAIQGLGTGTGFNLMLQDRSGTHTRRPSSARMANASSRPPGSGPRSAASSRPSSAERAADLRQGRSREGAERGGRHQRRVRDAAGFHGQRVHQQLQSLRPPVARLHGGGARVPRRSRQIDGFWVRSKQRRDGAPRVVRHDREHAGPQFTTRFNLFRAVEITGEPAPGYSSGQAMAALEERRARGARRPTTATRGTRSRTSKRPRRARAASSCSRCSSCS